MPPDLLAPFTIDHALTEEEQAFLAHVGESPDAQEVQAILEARETGIENRNRAKYLRIGTFNAKLVESFYHDALNPYITGIWSDQPAIALGGACIAIRLGLALLGQKHKVVLESLADSATFLGQLGRQNDALPRHEAALIGYKEVFGVEHPDTVIVMNNLSQCLKVLDPLAPFAIAQSLTEEELQLIEVLRTSEGGESHLRALEAGGVRFEATEEDGTRIVPWDADAEVIEPLLQQLLLPLSADLYQQGYTDLTLGAAGLALRVGLIALAPDHPDILTICNNRAACLQSLGSADAAMPLFERTLASRERVLGLDHSDTLSSRTNLAACLEQMGRSAEALPLLEHSLADLERALGPNHLNTLKGRNYLARCLHSLGRAGEALPLLERSLADHEWVLGPDHPDTLTSRNNLAQCLEALGRAGEALPLYEHSLADRERVLGPDHPSTLRSRNNLAGCLGTLGRAGEALPLYKCTLVDCKRVLGPDHPETLTSSERLATCLWTLGRAGEGLLLYERSLAARERVLGSDHPDTLSSRNNLAGCLRSLGREGEALPLYERTLTSLERVLGPDHPDSLGCCSNLAGCLDSLGRAVEALPLYKRSLAGLERIQDSNHPRILTNRNNLACCLESLGRAGEALHLYERTLADRERVLGPDHPDNLSSRNNLAGCLNSLGRAGEALQLYERTLADRERVLGPDHPDTLISRNNLAECLRSLGRMADALPLLESALADCEQIQGPNHPDTLSGRNNLALCLLSLGRANEALPLHERSLVDHERILGIEHPKTLNSRNNLAACLQLLERDKEELTQWLSQARMLHLRPQAGGAWLEMLNYCTSCLARFARKDQLSDWETHFSALSSSLLGVIDLESPEQMEVARAGVTKFYTIYLALCVDLDRRDLIPTVLAARQGRKLAALVLDELEAAGDTLDSDSPRGRLQTLRLELRQLALGLKVVEGGSGSFGSDGQRVVNADAFYARQRQQMDAYKDKLDQYRQLKTELEQTDADFAVSAAALNPTLPQLQAGLGEDEGLVLLFEVAGSDEEPATQLALLITRTGSVLVPLTGIQLQRSTDLVGSWRSQLHSRAGMRRASSRDSEALAAAPPADERIYSDLSSALRAGLWTPLAEKVKGLTRLHLVTHGPWHLLPVELGVPDHVELTHYPGFIYYHRLRHQIAMPGMAKGPESGAPSNLVPDETTLLGLAVHAAEDTPGLEAIPFVRAEADLIHALWPGMVQRDPDLDAEQPVLAALQLAAHGQADDKDPARANVILGNRILDFHAALGARQHPQVVVLSACTVGRTSDDPDGEPLGLVGSFLLKGTRYVIASLQPVPDFYMPLLMTLFYQAWPITGSLDQALAEAKRRLKAGDWYPETEALIRTHYQPIIEQSLSTVYDKPRQPGWQDPLTQLTYAWPFPKRYSCLHPDDDQHSLDELREDIKTEPGRIKMAGQILDTLVTGRANLSGAAIDTLCTWVRGFGEVGIR